MLDRPALKVYPGARFNSGAIRHSLPQLHLPLQNDLLAQLPLDCYEHLIPELEAVPLPQGSTLYAAGKRQNYLYFLTEGIVCSLLRLENGSSAEFGVTGREGVIGIAAYLGGECTPADALVVGEGRAFRLPANFLKSEFENCVPLRRLLLRYTQAWYTQVAQIAACKRHHTLQQQLCRWIVSCLDRVRENELTMSHELIAQMLGMRREGVTNAAGRLQQSGLIQYSRGLITVINREGLEAQACECYEVVKQEYERLLPASRIGGTTGLTSPRGPYVLKRDDVVAVPAPT